MAKYIIKHDRENCIGCAACEAVCPKFWEMAGDGKSNLKGSSDIENGWKSLEINNDEDFNCNKQAAESCPVNVIHIEDENGEKII